MIHHQRLVLQLTVLLAGLVSAAGCSLLPFGNRSVKEPSLIDQRQRVDVQLSLGRTFESQQQWDAARNVYNEILRNDPQQVEAAHRLAIVYSLRGDAESSTEWFERALQTDPKNADILCDLGYSLCRQGNLAGAESKLRQALSLDPQHQRARNHLGLVLARTDRREEALAEFGKAGCTASEAQANVVYALATDQQFERAALELEIAKRLPAGSPEQKQQLEAIASLLVGKDAPLNGPPLGTGSLDRGPALTSEIAVPTRSVSADRAFDPTIGR